jgi:predicted esterase
VGWTRSGGAHRRTAAALVPLAAVAGLLGVAGLCACHGRERIDASNDAGAAPAVDAAEAAGDAQAGAIADVAPTTDWCIEGLSALDEDACYILPPPAPGQPQRLLVYLHGIVPPLPDSPQKRAVQTAVLRASLRAGVAAIVPRGRRGVGPAQARDWWAWPTTARAVADLAPSIVARWIAAKKKLEALAGRPFERTYLAGSSNGAYFLTALAVRAGALPASFPIDGFGAMSGGAAGAGAPQLLAASPPRPFYVGFGAYDAESKANARGLVAALEAARWPVRAAEHPFGHGANQAYLDEAFAFWAEADLSPRRLTLSQDDSTK